MVARLQVASVHSMVLAAIIHLHCGLRACGGYDGRGHQGEQGSPVRLLLHRSGWRYSRGRHSGQMLDRKWSLLLLADAKEGGTGEIPILDFDPGPPFGFIHTLASMCFRDTSVRADRVLAIATAVAGEFQRFSWRLHDIVYASDVPPQGTLSAMLAPTRNNPILAKPIVELIRAIIYRYGRAGFDHVGTERDFWRLCHRRETRSFILRATNDTFRRIRVRLISNRRTGNYHSLSSVEPFARIMPKIMSLLLGDPMIASVALVIFDAIRHENPNDASRALARKIITNNMKIEHRGIGRERQIRAWGEWQPLLPLWAGVVTEARPWNPYSLIDEYRIQNMMLDVIADDERRMRAFAYASWFSKVATSNAHPRDHLPYLIRPDQIVRIDIEPKEPPRVRFPEAMLASVKQPKAAARKR